MSYFNQEKLVIFMQKHIPGTQKTAAYKNKDMFSNISCLLHMVFYILLLNIHNRVADLYLC